MDLLTEQRNQLREQVGGVIARQKELLRQHEQLIARHQALAPDLESHPLAEQLLDRDADKRDGWLSQQLSQLSEVISRDEQRQQALLTLQKTLRACSSSFRQRPKPARPLRAMLPSSSSNWRPTGSDWKKN